MSVAVEHIVLPSERLIINHDMSSYTGDEQPVGHLSSSRALAISEPGDIIQLHPTLRDQWDEVTAHFQRIGLRHTRNVVWSLNPKELGCHAGYHPSVYYFSPNACQFWGDYEWLAIVEWISSKNNFALLTNELGVPTPQTLCFKSVFDISDAIVQSMQYPCYLKSALPASGNDVIRCRNQHELNNALLNIKPSVPVQLQAEVMTDTILTLQFSISGNRVKRLAATEKPSHESRFACHPALFSQAPWALVEPIVNWLNKRGMKGVVAFDIAQTHDQHDSDYVVIGCNPRFDDAAYPTLIGEKLGIPEWQLLTLPTRYRQISALDIADIEYEQSTGEGAILVNWGTIEQGELSIMLAGSADYQAALEVELRARL